MRADKNIVQVCPFLSQKSLHLAVNLVQPFPGDFPAGDYRLVGDNDSQMATLVDSSDSLCRTVQQFKLLWFTQETYIFIDGPVPVKKNRPLLLAEVFPLHQTGFQVLLHLGDALRGAHILDILRGTVDKNLPGGNPRFENLPVQVHFLRGGH